MRCGHNRSFSSDQGHQEVRWADTLAPWFICFECTASSLCYCHITIIDAGNIHIIAPISRNALQSLCSFLKEILPWSVHLTSLMQPTSFVLFCNLPRFMLIEQHQGKQRLGTECQVKKKQTDLRWDIDSHFKLGFNITGSLVDSFRAQKVRRYSSVLVGKF